jgi:hypothetical protein
MMIVAACFTFIESLAFFIEQWWMAEAWWLLGGLDVAAFILALVGAISIFRRTWRYLALAAAVLLIVAATSSVFSNMVGLAIFILILSIISLTLLLLSWSQFNEPRPYQFGMFPMMPGMPQGVPPPSLMMPPPSNMGAPPPSPMMSPPSNMGAPPPVYAQPAGPPPDALEEGPYQVDDYVGNGRR